MEAAGPPVSTRFQHGVVVDLEVADGVLRHVRRSSAGDSSNQDEALDAINGGLDGAPADTDAAGLRGRRGGAARGRR
ncbi:hypothetical protein SALBM135S_07573 [Streptomyces alboniger]